MFDSLQTVSNPKSAFIPASRHRGHWRSFIRNAIFSVIAGNPPANAAQPSGINGIIVTVVIKAESSENSQMFVPKLKNKSPPNNDSATPKK